MICLDCKELGRVCPKCKLRNERDRLKQDNAALRAALAPFVKFIEAWDAQPIRTMADDFYGIHTGTEWEASLKLSDFRAAREALASPPGERRCG